MEPRLIPTPTRIPCPGTPVKMIDEVVGRVNTGTESVSLAHMNSPAGWTEPGQTPEFDEYSYVLSGALRVEHRGGEVIVRAGQGVHAPAGMWVRYSTPEGAEYISVCSTAFSPDSVHRDED